MCQFSCLNTRGSQDRVVVIRWSDWCCYWQTASVPRQVWTWLFLMILPPPGCNRALKSLSVFLFLLCFFEISQKRLKLFNIRPISSFCKKTWNVKKCCGRTNLDSVHIKASISISHDSAKRVWRVPGFNISSWSCFQVVDNYFQKFNWELRLDKNNSSNR